LGLLGIAAAAYGFFGMESRLNARDTAGLITDPDARATAYSWQGCRTIETLRDQPALAGLPVRSLRRLVLLQTPADATEAEAAARLGERWTHPSEVYDALGGPVGPRLLLGPGAEVAWTNGLTTVSSEAFVLCETGTGFRVWGMTPNALLYAALTDVARRQFPRARQHLKRAADLNDENILFVSDDGQLVAPLADAVANLPDFLDWTVGLLDQGVSRLEVGGLQDLFIQLLSRATGRRPADLTAGSHLVGPPREPAPRGAPKGSGP
ncbi:hypothetical protein KDM41_12475, partial [bacterium]|nr:hypothetical protein [bacterium]